MIIDRLSTNQSQLLLSQSIIDRRDLSNVLLKNMQAAGSIAKVRAYCVLTYKEVFSRGSSVITALFGHYLLLVYGQMVLMSHSDSAYYLSKTFWYCSVLPIRVPPSIGIDFRRMTSYNS